MEYLQEISLGKSEKKVTVYAREEWDGDIYFKEYICNGEDLAFWERFESIFNVDIEDYFFNKASDSSWEPIFDDSCDQYDDQKQSEI